MLAARLGGEVGGARGHSEGLPLTGSRSSWAQRSPAAGCAAARPRRHAPARRCQNCSWHRQSPQNGCRRSRGGGGRETAGRHREHQGWMQQQGHCRPDKTDPGFDGAWRRWAGRQEAQRGPAKFPKAHKLVDDRRSIRCAAFHAAQCRSAFVRAQPPHTSRKTHLPTSSSRRAATISNPSTQAATTSHCGCRCPGDGRALAVAPAGAPAAAAARPAAAARSAASSMGAPLPPLALPLLPVGAIEQALYSCIFWNRRDTCGAAVQGGGGGYL